MRSFNKNNTPNNFIYIILYNQILYIILQNLVIKKNHFQYVLNWLKIMEFCHHLFLKKYIGLKSKRKIKFLSILIIMFEILYQNIDLKKRRV